MTYEKYCADLKRFNQPITMNEKEWNSKYGVQEEYTPFLARRSSSHKNVEPTLSNHSAKSSSKPQLKVNLLDIPKSSQLLEELEKRISDKKPRSEKKEKVLTRLPNSIPKTSLAGMSDDEKRLHKNKVKRETAQRKKEMGIVYVKTEEQKQRQREYSREWYKLNQEVQREKERMRRESLSEEKKEEIKAVYRKWQKENRDRINATAREWKARNKEKVSAQKKIYYKQKKEKDDNERIEN